jgi:hypothetical protein
LGTKSALTGTNDIAFNNNGKSISAYHNHLITNQLTILLTGFEDQSNVKIRIINLTGQTVFEKLENNPVRIELNTSILQNKSAYIVSVESSQSTLSGKVFTMK